MVKEYISNSYKETEIIGRNIAELITVGSVVALYGNLGSGKTTFTRGILQGLFPLKKIKVKSPSFALINQYNSSDVVVYHIDCYRIEDINEFFNIGIDDFLFSDGIAIIEWPERIEEILPAGTIKIYFEFLSENKRKIILK